MDHHQTSPSTKVARGPLRRRAHLATATASLANLGHIAKLATVAKLATTATMSLLLASTSLLLTSCGTAATLGKVGGAAAREASINANLFIGTDRATATP